jgi:hypothetical protein
MRMKPSWIIGSLDCISAQQHKFTHKYGECFYWVEQQNEFAWKIYTVCFHVGQMLFAGNKYLLLKRITVQRRTKPQSAWGWKGTEVKKCNEKKGPEVKVPGDGKDQRSKCNVKNVQRSKCMEMERTRGQSSV